MGMPTGFTPEGLVGMLCSARGETAALGIFAPEEEAIWDGVTLFVPLFRLLDLVISFRPLHRLYVSMGVSPTDLDLAPAFPVSEELTRTNPKC